MEGAKAETLLVAIMDIHNTTIPKDIIWHLLQNIMYFLNVIIFGCSKVMCLAVIRISSYQRLGSHYSSNGLSKNTQRHVLCRMAG